MTQPEEPRSRCRRCKDRLGIHTLRAEYVCSDCYCRFISTKTVKRLEVLNREPRFVQHRRPGGGSGRPPLSNKTFLVGLSLGPSSTALVDICEQIIVGQLAKGRDAAFTLRVVHVDTGLVDDGGEPAGGPSPSPSPSSSSSPSPNPNPSVAQLLDRWRARYPRFTFEHVPLTEVLSLDALDWSLLLCPGARPPLDDADDAASPPADRLRAMLDRLPSAASRSDVLGLLVRRLLIARTAASGCDALLLGCSTTALAERTLAETAKGRGFSVPWQTNDGPAGPVAPAGGSDASASDGGVLLYYPLRELFRKEVVTYAGLTQPPLNDLIMSQPPSVGAGAIVSHKDLSIEEVMARYFAEVEENYPSIVANVVRTSGKLARRGLAEKGTEEEGKDTQSGSSRCGVCDMSLDEAGNERWKGEIGDLDGSGQMRSTTKLCYGCERSIYG